MTTASYTLIVEEGPGMIATMGLTGEEVARAVSGISAVLDKTPSSYQVIVRVIAESEVVH